MIITMGELGGVAVVFFVLPFPTHTQSAFFAAKHLLLLLSLCAVAVVGFSTLALIARNFLSSPSAYTLYLRQ